MPVIYQIVNKQNGKRYVGKAKTLRRRWTEHLRRANAGHNTPLYAAIRKYGVKLFSLEVLETCEMNESDFLEQKWIANLSPEYNLTPGGDGGDTFSVRSKKAQRITRRKLSQKMKVLAKDPEYIRKVSDGVRLAQRDPEVKRRISDGIKRSNRNPEVRKRRSNASRKNALKNRHKWSECKRGKRNGRWLGYLDVHTPDGIHVWRFETAVECCKTLGLSAHLVRQKARTGETMERGEYRGYTFKLVRDE